MTRRETRREILEKLLKEAGTDEGIPEAWENEAIDTALKSLDKLELTDKQGAYKSGYHDALNNRPYKEPI